MSIQLSLEHDNRGFDVIAAILERLGGFGFSFVGGKHGEANRAFHEFDIGGLKINHQVAVNLMQPHHDARGERIERDFLCRACFQTCAARNDFRASLEQNSNFGLLENRGVWVVADADSQRSDSFCCRERSEGVRG